MYIRAEDILLTTDVPASEGVIFIDRNSLMVDFTNGNPKYKLYVNNGVLCLSETEDSVGACDSVVVSDRTTREYYSIFVDGNQLKMESIAQSSTINSTDTIPLIDATTGELRELYVTNGNLAMSFEDFSINVDLDTVFSIDLDTREILIPQKIKCLGVESDDDVFRVRWKIPRYFYDVDLSDFQIRINYKNANDEDDVYKVGDVRTTANAIEFSWLVGRYAAKYQGNVKFNLCLIKLGLDGVTVNNEFNTTYTTLPILKGLETAEAVIQNHADAIEEFRLQQREQIKEAIYQYIDEHDTIVSDDALNRIVSAYMAEHPFEVTDDLIYAAVGVWMDNNEPLAAEIRAAVSEYMQNYDVSEELEGISEEIRENEKLARVFSVGVDPYIPAWNGILTKTFDGSYITPSDNSGINVSGIIQGNIVWQISYDGYLIISGNGQMLDYNSGSSQPWYNYRSSINGIIIEEGITHIGAFAFYFLQNVMGDVVLPYSVTSIGDYAFTGCTSLTSMYVEGVLSNVGMYNISNFDSVYFVGDEHITSDLTLHNQETTTNTTIYFRRDEDTTVDEIFSAIAKMRNCRLRYTDGENNVLCPLESISETKAVFTGVNARGELVRIEYTDDDIVSYVVNPAAEGGSGSIDTASLVGWTPGLLGDGDTTFAWDSNKRTITATSTDHVIAYGKKCSINSSGTPFSVSDITDTKRYGYFVFVDSDGTVTQGYGEIAFENGRYNVNGWSPYKIGDNQTRFLLRVFEFKLESNSNYIMKTGEYDTTGDPLYCPYSQKIYFQ